MAGSDGHTAVYWRRGTQGLPAPRSCRLVVEDLTKSYRSAAGGDLKVIDDMTLCAPVGEIISIFGPSGCGKTTLLNVFAGFDDPDGGRVLLDGEEVRGPGPERGVVFQAPALFPWLTAVENVAFGPRHQGVDRSTALERAREMLDVVGLRGFEGHRPEQLSGGMKQRVALARVLVNEPRILLMDEPFASLDAQARSEMQRLVLRVWEEFRPTIVFVTHDPEEAVLLASRIYVLTRRPARIDQEIEVGLPRPRDPLSPGFLDIKARLLQRLRTDTGDR